MMAGEGGERLITFDDTCGVKAQRNTALYSREEQVAQTDRHIFNRDIAKLIMVCPPREDGLNSQARLTDNRHVSTLVICFLKAQ